MLEEHVVAVATTMDQTGGVVLHLFFLLRCALSSFMLPSLQKPGSPGLSGRKNEIKPEKTDVHVMIIMFD